MKEVIKYAAAILDYYGPGNHIYWNGVEWTALMDEGILYSTKRAAEEECWNKGGEGKVIEIIIFYK